MIAPPTERWFHRFARCPVCAMRPRAMWLFGDATGETIWSWFLGEQICHTCVRWALGILRP